jgi:hypothetical protein
MRTTPEIQDAYEAFKKADRKVYEAVEAAYPIGRRVRVTIGGHSVLGVVEGHARRHWNLGLVYVRNTVTGKARKFDALHSDASLVELP